MERHIQVSVPSVRRVPYWAQVGLLAAVYFAAAKLSLSLAIPPGYATAVWPPSGIALAAALALGNRVWPGIWIGAALVNLTVEFAWPYAVLIGTGNTLEALAGATLIRRFVGVPYRFERGEDVVKFIALSALCATIAATIGLMPLIFGHPMSWPETFSNWLTWWQGDVSGMVIVAPLILSWSTSDAEISPSRKFEAACFSLLLLAVMYAVFGYGSQTAPYQWPFLILLFVVWAAFRFSQRGVITVIAAVCAMAVAYTIEKRGPFALTSHGESLLLMQGFISIVVVTGLLLSTALRERTRNLEELRSKRDELEVKVRERTLELERANRALQRDIETRKLAETALYESEQNLAAAQRVARLGSWELDLDNLRNLNANPLRWSEETFRIFGHEPGTVEVSNENFFKAVHPDDRERVSKAVTDALKEGMDYSVEHRIIRPDGSERIVHEMSGIVRDGATGKVVKMIGTVQDITERKLAEERLRESEMRFRLIVENVVDYAILMLDPQGHVVSWNAGAERIKGYREDEIIGQHFSRFYPPEELARGKPQHGLEVASAAGRFEDEGWRVRKDGSTFWANVVITPLRDASGTLRGFGKVTRDLTERRRSEERLAYLAQNDALTKLPNRHMLHDHLVRTLAAAPHGKWVGCMYIDLDRFKYVNDTFGHGVGDQLLVEVANRLQHCLRATDVVGRLGGDEFAVVLASLAKHDDAALVGQKVCAALAAPFNLAGRETYVTGSIGIAIFPEDGRDADTLLKNADTAMYQAKEQGRNNYQLYAPKMDERASQRLHLDARLRGALERKEFVLHYQPKADLSTGAVSGFEALLRWQDPQEGLISPARFIPILEDTGLMVPVGEWVLQAACEQIKQWQGQGVQHRPVSVNVSARQFQQKDFDAIVSRIIADAGIDPALIQLELTESLLMKDAEETVRVLASLKSSGVTLSVDDFGTGYSSLAYLRRFPLDELKIDGSFVRDATSEPEDAEITLAIINLAHTLKLRVVAEGVETEAQLRFLRSHGCDAMQGYYFARPLEVDACTRMLLENTHLQLPAPENLLSKHTVLIVDDDDNDRELMRRALTAEKGYRIFTADSAQAALETLAQHKVDIVVSDQKMNGMDGVRFLTSVRKLYPDLVRILASGSGDYERVTVAVNEAGIHKYLSKDWDAARLRAGVRDALVQVREASAPSGDKSAS